MLARFLRSMEGKARTGPSAMPLTRTKSCSQPVALTTGPNDWPEPAPEFTEPKRRPKRVQIARLYPERPSEASKHARALIDFIQEECPDFAGLYVPKSDLERTYWELCAVQSWETHHWTAIARQLGALTKKREVKRSGTRFVAYQIPRPQFRQRSAP